MRITDAFVVGFFVSLGKCEKLRVLRGDLAKYTKK